VNTFLENGRFFDIFDIFDILHVAFFNSAPCLVKHPKQKKSLKNHKCNESKVFFGGARPGSASGCFKKATQATNTGHLRDFFYLNFFDFDGL
jgi:hypothetical protein